MKIKVALALTCLLFALGFLFREKLSLYIVDWGVQVVSHRDFGAQIDYAKIRHEDGSYILESAHLRPAVGQGDWSLEADEVRVSFKPKWWKGRLEMDLDLVNGHVRLLQGGKVDLPVFSGGGPYWGLLRKSWRFQADQVTIDLVGRSSSDPLDRLLVDLEGRGGRTTHFHIGISRQETEPEVGAAELWWDMLPMHSELLLACKNVEAAPLFRIAQAFSPDCNEWRISHGTVTGALALTKEKHGSWKPREDGSLIARKMVFGMPSRQLSVQVPELCCDLNEGLAQDSIIAQLRIVQGASITQYQDNQQQTSLHQFTGSLALDSLQVLRIEAQGLFHQGRDPRNLHLSGQLCLRDELGDFANFNLRLESETSDDLAARLCGSRKPSGRAWSGSISNLGAEQWTLASSFASEFFPQLAQYHIQGGVMDAELAWEESKQGLLSLSVPSLYGRDIEGTCFDADLHFRLGFLSGNGTYDFAQKTLLDGVNGVCSLSDGHLAVQRMGDQPMVIHDIDGTLAMAAGVLQPSDFKFSIGAAQANLSVEGPKSDTAYVVQLEGAVDSLVPFFSKSVRMAWSRAHAGRTLRLRAEGSPADSPSVTFSGTAEFVGGASGSKDLLHFGFEIQRDTHNAWPAPLLSNATVYQRLVQGMDHCGLRLSNGWFSGKQIAVSPYIAPFIFHENAFEMSGLADLRGTFEGGHVITRYNAQGLRVEGSEVLLELPTLGQRLGTARDESDFLGVYHIDFARDKRYGFAAIEGGTLSLTKSQLKFGDCKGAVTFEGSEVFVKNLTSTAEGVDFGGKLHFTTGENEDGYFGLEIQTQKIEGSVRDVSGLLDKLTEEPIGRLPLSGTIAVRKPAFLRLKVGPGGNEIEAQVEGCLEDGVLDLELTGVRSEGLTSVFTYDHKQGTLTISKLDGRILLGADQNIDEYTLRARHLSVYGFPHCQADFDIRLEGRTRDLVRLVGNTAQAPEYGPGAMNIAFDPNHTYLGTVQPNISKLVLKGWKELLALQAEPTANLSSLMGDLERVARSGGLVVSSEFLLALRDYDPSGELIASLSYAPDSPFLAFDLQGDAVRIANEPMSSCQVSGRYGPNRWVIDQLQLDELSLSADLRTHESGAQVDFLGLRYGKALLAGFEGDYLCESRSLEGRVTLLDIDLAQAEMLPSFPRGLESAALKGKMHGTGTVRAELVNEAPFIRCEADLNTALRDFSLMKVPFRDSTDIACRISTERGVTIGGTDLAIKHAQLGLAPVGAVLDRLSYDFATQAIEVAGLHFKMPAQNLPWLSGFLGEQLPSVVSPKRELAVREILDSGSLQGELSFGLAPSYQAWKLELGEGNYFYGGQSHHLRQLTFAQDPVEFCIDLQYLYNQHYYRAQVRSALPGLNQGSVELTELDSFAVQNRLPLSIDWEWDKASHLLVKRVEGEFAGISANLHQMESGRKLNTLILGGQIAVDVSQAHKLLPPEFTQGLERIQLGSGYELNGRWEISTEDLNAVGFEGVLGGHNFELFDYRLKSLFAHVDFHDGCLEVNKLRISDMAGEFEADNVRVLKNHLDRWEFHAPLMTIHDLRPSLLQLSDGQTQRPKPLLLKRLEVQNLKGTLGDPSSFVGKGSLNFVNPSKANIQNTILAIPSDILARIGLDLDLLTPVVGTVYYDVRDSRIYLNQFKDMYSEGRVSRFYLGGPNNPSYLDFDGRMNVKVRMKQYNLIFKLAELFTISVRGDYGRPTYSLQKLADSHEPEESDDHADAA